LKAIGNNQVISTLPTAVISNKTKTTLPIAASFWVQEYKLTGQSIHHSQSTRPVKFSIRDEK
jgi:hypothetical protein